MKERAKSPRGRALNAIVQSRRKDRYNKNSLGILASVEEIIEVQKQTSCALCGRSDVKLNTDHDHETGRLRAMLCTPCNRLAVSEERLLKVLAYVQKYKV